MRAGDFARAEAEVLPLAKTGDPAAELSLGVMYFWMHPPRPAEGKEWILKAAEQGYIEAYEPLGNLYNGITGLPPDNFKAYVWLNIAVATNSSVTAGMSRDFVSKNLTVDQIAQAQSQSTAYFKPVQLPAAHTIVDADDALTLQDYNQAASILLALANTGNADASARLGDLYISGQGVPRNYALGIAAYQTAADGGSALAQNTLGDLYYNGQIVPKQPVLAAEMWSKAAKNNIASAQFNLARMLDRGELIPQDLPRAASLYEQSAEQGTSQAQLLLGLMLLDGHGIDQDCEKAVAWIRKSAEQGLAPAQLKLGVLYANGQCVAKSDTEAVPWFQKAAEQHLPIAYILVGAGFEGGLGVAQNRSAAHKWYNLAAAASNFVAHDVAVAARDRVAATMSDAEIAAAQAQASQFDVDPRISFGTPTDAEQALQRGDYANAVLILRGLSVSARARGAPAVAANAEMQYGDLLTRGLGRPQDFALAVQSYEAAAKDGNTEARLRLAAAYEVGHGVERNSIMALAYYEVASRSADETIRASAVKAREALTKVMAPTDIAAARRRAGEIEGR